jgi:hypothetical protein
MTTLENIQQLALTAEWRDLIGTQVSTLTFPDGTETALYATILTGTHASVEETRRLTTAIIAARTLCGDLSDTDLERLSKKLAIAVSAQTADKTKPQQRERRVGSADRTPRPEC